MDPPETTVPPPPPPIGRVRAKHCDVRGCDADSLRNPDLLFVAVPSHSYPERRFVWLTLMQSVRDKKRSYCCSRHFKIPDDYRDFNEFISAPPGYKRQLLVNKGVVPHLNMPPLVLSGLPPLTNRWPLTLPDSMRENYNRGKQSDNSQQQSVSGFSPPGMSGIPMSSVTAPNMHGNAGSQRMVSYRPNMSMAKFCKAVQTEANPVSGPRMMQPSLQYCRLCFKRQNLEPIFTGDQTLIEPDLIDKIYGCTEVMITVENDFPSSICTDCYGSVQDFNKFRKLVQQNNESLRLVNAAVVNSGSSMSMVRSNSNEGIRHSTVRPLSMVTPVRSIPTIMRHSMSKITPYRPPPSVPVASIPRPFIQRRTVSEDDDLLEVGRVEDVRTYQRRKMEKQMSRGPRETQPRFSFPPPGKSVDLDPLGAGGFSTSQIKSVDTENSLAKGVQAQDRVVPVTLIRIMPEVDNAVESNTPQQTDDQLKQEDLGVETSPKRNFLQPKPIEALTGSTENKLDSPNVLQAVKLIPASAAKSFTKVRPAGAFLRPASSKGLNMQRMLKIIRHGDKKSHLGSQVSSKIARAVKFPGTLTTLFSKPKKLPKPTTQTAEEQPKIVNPPKVSKPVAIPQVPDVVKDINETEMPEKLPAEQAQLKQQINKSDQPKETAREKLEVNNSPTIFKSIRTPTPTPKILKEGQISDMSPGTQLQTKLQMNKSDRSKQKENDIPVKPKETSRPKPNAEIAQRPKPPASKSERPQQKENDAPESSKQPPTEASSNVPPVSPRSTRERKIPLKFQNTVGFPMPKMLDIKQEPEETVVEPPELATESPKTRSAAVKKPTSSKQSQVEQGKTKSDQETPAVRSRPVTRRSDPTVAVSKPVATKSSADSKPKQTAKPDSVTAKVPAVPKPQTVPRVTEALRLRALKRKSLPEVKTASTLPPKKSPKLNDPKQGRLTPATKAKQTQQQQQRANGSRKSAPAKVPIVKEAATETKSPSSKSIQSSQDWKCPFCSDKVFDQKKGLVRHLRKRHGMDYALVRQRLAIYGGNWR
ncbi:uncharacterized protein LOC131433541 [Malaya genurostris]|uniref:uncharacterized protein LOC131433541 n=1 Tax=Malaya genurostris TaxID=325434 RepID=UPI0026F3DB8E|nr:uncharacterized protein LOC131433541 [Malaya genurostris]